MNTFSLEYVESLYSEYLRDPFNVEPAWRHYFEDFLDQTQQPTNGSPVAKTRPVREAGRAATPTIPTHGTRPQRVLDVAQLQDRVDQLIRGYRVRGHMMAKLDPLGMARPGHVELDPESYGLSAADLDRQFSTTSIYGPSVQTLGGILERLQNTYCRSVGAQFMHIDDRNVRDWLQTRMEGSENRLDLSAQLQTRILTRLTDAVIFEGFVRKKFVGAKTFSLEGAESLIPLLDLALEKAGEHGIKEIVMAMAHRGRLNVLANVMHKRAKNIFWEFDDPHPELHRGGGDVRYHMGYSSDWSTSSGENIHLSLCFNPSHLEYVNTVAQGRLRSKQARVGDHQHRRGMVILIHGDAAFAGEGIVQETLNLSQLPGYSTGGTLHVIVNNQLGFTTPPEQGRSTFYASDVAKMLQIPIFHVNGEDPEAVAQVVALSMDFRREFQRDVVIDMYCYRRWGHNEGDEPRFTQPLMYHKVDERKSVRDGYLEHLLELGEITRDDAEQIAQQRSHELEQEFEEAKGERYTPDHQSLGGVWQGYYGGHEPSDDDPDTGVDVEQLESLLTKLAQVPEDFQLHRKLQRFFKQRQEMAKGQAPLDWSAAEAAAFASLVTEGHRVRLSGQDSARGTFSQRHSIVYDTKHGGSYTPLAHLAPDQAPIELINSPLSEAGVLGFEYGFSLDYPEALVAWEAQFGDFWNAAQVIVDQFIASAEDKWRRLSGLTMLLPHGFEGQGPEHASARLERFLLLTAEHNIQVTVPSTPAQYFHLLRRQVKRAWRKPLIVLTPKSLLRHPSVVSDLKEFTSGRFERVLPDARADGYTSTDRILLCSGKIYYELAAEREERGRDDVAIVRLEQLYPIPEKQLAEALQTYRDGTPVVWVQEEPANMGAWQHLRIKFGETLDERFPLSRISRPESASPASGSAASHKLEQQDLLTHAFSEMGSLVGK